MRSNVEPLEGNKVKLSVEVDEAELETAIDAAFRKIAQEVRLPGFRPGKAPRKLLENRLGVAAGREQAFQDALPEWYSAAVIEHDVDVIAPPEIDITAGREDGPLAFDAVVEVRPTVSVPGYGGLRVELERPAVADEEIDAQIDRMRQVEATLATVERPAIEGDAVTVDIAGTLDGEAQDGLTADDYSYTVGSGAITPEVDEALTGSKAGDILEVEASHPDPEETRQLKFRILVKEVQETVLPEVTDEWAAGASDFETVEELREDLANRMSAVRRAQAQMALREKVGEALAQLVEEEIPEPLVAAEMQQRIQDLAMRLQAQGMQLEQWLAMSGEDPQTFTDQLKETAATSVKVDLALRAVVAAEGIEVADDDLEEELASVAQRVGAPVDEVREQFERGGQISAVRSDIAKRRALEWLLERVEVVDTEGQPIDRADLEVADDEADEDADHEHHDHDHEHHHEHEDDQ
jgi:trigger factor